MSVRTKRWDATDHLNSETAIEAYVEAAAEDGDPALVAAVRDDVARARGKERAMTLPSERDIGHMLGKPRGYSFVAGVWYPIETAPRDRPVLVYDPEGVDVDEHAYAWPKGARLHSMIAVWTKHEDYGEGWFTPLFSLSFGVWDDPSLDIEPVTLKPIYWSPLPEPPHSS